MKTRLDRIDKKILQALTEDGRISNQDLADRCGLSPPPTLRRVRELKKYGFIRGFHADIEPAGAGYPSEAHVLVDLDWRAEKNHEQFAGLVDGISNVRSCYLTHGGFVLRIVARSADDLNGTVLALRSAENVLTCTAYITIMQTKNAHGVPLEARHG